MTVKERIRQAVDSMDCDVDDINKIVALAYYMGREQAAKEVCDRANTIFAAQRKAAQDCRYRNMAMQIQGGYEYIHHADYSQTMSDMFGADYTSL